MEKNESYFVSSGGVENDCFRVSSQILELSEEPGGFAS